MNFFRCCRFFNNLSIFLIGWFLFLFLNLDTTINKQRFLLFCRHNLCDKIFLDTGYGRNCSPINRLHVLLYGFLHLPSHFFLQIIVFEKIESITYFLRKKEEFLWLLLLITKRHRRQQGCTTFPCAYRRKRVWFKWVGGGQSEERIQPEDRLVICLEVHWLVLLVRLEEIRSWVRVKLEREGMLDWLVLGNVWLLKVYWIVQGVSDYLSTYRGIEVVCQRLITF